MQPFHMAHCTVPHLKSIADRFRDTLATVSATNLQFLHNSVGSISVHGGCSAGKSTVFVDVFRSFYEYKKVSGTAVTRSGRTGIFSAYTYSDTFQQATEWAGDDLLLSFEAN